MTSFLIYVAIAMVLIFYGQYKVHFTDRTISTYYPTYKVVEPEPLRWAIKDDLTGLGSGNPRIEVTTFRGQNKASIKIIL